MITPDNRFKGNSCLKISFFIKNLRFLKMKASLHRVTKFEKIQSRKKNLITHSIKKRKIQIAFTLNINFYR